MPALTIIQYSIESPRHSNERKEGRKDGRKEGRKENAPKLERKK